MFVYNWCVAVGRARHFDGGYGMPGPYTCRLDVENWKMFGREKMAGGGGRCVRGAAVWALVLGVMLAAGCDKALETYKEGEELLAHGQYDLAVSRLDSAYQQCRQRKRDCSMFAERLAHARRVAGEHYYSLAQTDFIATRLNDAARHIGKALEHVPTDGVYVNLRERIMEETLAVEGLRRRALELAGRQAWDEAIAAMQEAIARNRTMSGAQGELERIKRDAYNWHVAGARGLLEEGRWDEAVSEANRALYYYAGSEAKGIVAEVANRREAVGLIEQAMAVERGGGDPQAVLDMLEKARRLYGSHPEIEALVLGAKQAVCDVKIAMAVQAIDADALHEALGFLHQSNRVLKDYGGASELIVKISQRIAQRQADAGDGFRLRQQYGNAALHYVTALGYRESFAQARTGLAEMMGVLRESVKYSIGYIGLDSSWQDRKAADGIEAGLLQHISKSRPANIVVKDASGLKAAIGRVNASIIEMDILDARLESSRPKDVDAFMMGQLLSRDFVAAESVTSGRSKFQSGTRMDANPEYHKAHVRAEKLFADHAAAVIELAAVRIKANKMMDRREGESDSDYRRRRDDARKMITQAEKKAGALHAELEKARAHLANTPPHLAIPIISEYEYPIVRVSRTARVGVLLKMIDARTGAVLVAEKVEGSHTAEDIYIAPDPARNVPGDALELPADDYLMGKATEQVMGKLAGLCNSYFANHPRRFAAMMNQARSDGDEEGAVEYGMRYLITPGNGGGDRSNTIGYLRAVVAGRNEGNGPDLNGLLARYYKP